MIPLARPTIPTSSSVHYSKIENGIIIFAWFWKVDIFFRFAKYPRNAIVTIDNFRMQIILKN